MAVSLELFKAGLLRRAFLSFHSILSAVLAGAGDLARANEGMANGRTGSGGRQRERCQLEQDLGPLSQPEHRTQPHRARGHDRAVRGALAADLARPLFRLLDQPAARGPGCRLPRPPVHDPARLRPRLVLPQQVAQRLDRPRARRADVHALRFLAPHPRGASCLVGQSRAPRHGRHRYAHRRANISRCRGMAGCAIASTGTRW